MPRWFADNSLSIGRTPLVRLNLMTNRTQGVRHRRDGLAKRFGTPAHMMLRAKCLQQLPLRHIHRQQCDSIGQRRCGDASDDP